MSEINEAVAKAIKENLSGQVADELSKVLKNYEKLKEEYPKLTKERDRLVSRLSVVDSELYNANKNLVLLREKEQSVSEREIKVRIDERELELTILGNNYNALLQSKEEIKSLVDKVFSVPTVTVTNSKTKSGNMPMPNDSYTFYDTENTTEVNTKTESK